MHSGLGLRAVFFDLDGTLAHTAPELGSALNQMLRDIGLPLVDEALATTWIGHGTRELTVRSIAQATGAGLDQVRQDERLPQALARFDHHYQTCLGTRSVLYPGVRETLTALRERGCRMAVVTNKESRHTDRLIEALELRSFFERVVSGDTFPTRKPDPVGVLACLEAWRIDPQQGLFVGDSAIDAQTARRAGLPVFLLTYGYNMGRDVRESQPDRVLDHFAEILQALGPPALS